MFCFSLGFFVLTKSFGLQTYELVIEGKVQVKMILLKMSQFHQMWTGSPKKNRSYTCVSCHFLNSCRILLLLFSHRLFENENMISLQHSGLQQNCLKAALTNDNSWSQRVADCHGFCFYPSTRLFSSSLFCIFQLTVLLFWVYSLDSLSPLSSALIPDTVVFSTQKKPLQTE